LASGSLRRFLSGLNGRQEDSDQSADDRHDYEQFHEGQTAFRLTRLGTTTSATRIHYWLHEHLPETVIFYQEAKSPQKFFPCSTLAVETEIPRFHKNSGSIREKEPVR
jgi:hypothetical protein